MLSERDDVAFIDRPVQHCMLSLTSRRHVIGRHDVVDIVSGWQRVEGTDGDVGGNCSSILTDFAGGPKPSIYNVERNPICRRRTTASSYICVWLVQALSYTARTIANIGQRQASAVLVKQDLISCLTRCSERERRTIARPVRLYNTIDWNLLITTRGVGSSPRH